MIPTSKELVKELVKKRYPLYGSYLCENEKKWIAELAVEFAKLHVEAALKAASENAETDIEFSNPYDPSSEYSIVNKQSILNSYPLTNIE